MDYYHLVESTKGNKRLKKGSPLPPSGPWSYTTQMPKFWFLEKEALALHALIAHYAPNNLASFQDPLALPETVEEKRKRRALKKQGVLSPTVRESPPRPSEEGEGFVEFTGGFGVYLCLRIHSILRGMPQSTAVAPLFRPINLKKETYRARFPRCPKDVLLAQVAPALQLGYLPPVAEGDATPENANDAAVEEMPMTELFWEAVSWNQPDVALIILQSGALENENAEHGGRQPTKGFAETWAQWQHINPPPKGQSKVDNQTLFWKNIWFRSITGGNIPFANLALANNAVTSINERAVRPMPYEDDGVGEDSGALGLLLGGRKFINQLPHRLAQVLREEERAVMVRWLLSRGANPNAGLNRYDVSPVCSALYEWVGVVVDNHTEKVTREEELLEELCHLMLQKYGGDINLEMPRGATPFGGLISHYFGQRHKSWENNKAVELIKTLSSEKMGGDVNPWQKQPPHYHQRKKAGTLPTPSRRCPLVDCIDQGCMKADGGPLLDRLITEFGCDPHWVETDTPNLNFRARLATLNYGRNLGFWTSVNFGFAAIKVLHKHGVDLEHNVPFDGLNALSLATFKNATENIELLLECGVNPKYGCSEEKYLAYPSTSGGVPLIQPILGAAWSGNPAVLKTLLQRGGDPNASCLNYFNLFKNAMSVGDDCPGCGQNWANRTPEIDMADEGATVACLVAGGFDDTYRTNRDEETLACLEILKEFGADFSQRDSLGRGPLDYANLILTRRQGRLAAGGGNPIDEDGIAAVVAWLEDHCTE